jgi:hypothetical protein
MEKMDEYFRSPESERQSETQGGKCVKCNLAFAIGLPVKSDPRNQNTWDTSMQSSLMIV